MERFLAQVDAAIGNEVAATAAGGKAALLPVDRFSLSAGQAAGFNGRWLRFLRFGWRIGGRCMGRDQGRGNGICLGCYGKIGFRAYLNKLIAAGLIVFRRVNLHKEIYELVTIGLIDFGAYLDRLVTVGFCGFRRVSLDRLNNSKLIFGLRVLVRRLLAGWWLGIGLFLFGHVGFFSLPLIGCEFNFILRF